MMFCSPIPRSWTLTPHPAQTEARGCLVPSQRPQILRPYTLATGTAAPEEVCGHGPDPHLHRSAPSAS